MLSEKDLSGPCARNILKSVNDQRYKYALALLGGTASMTTFPVFLGTTSALIPPCRRRNVENIKCLAALLDRLDNVCLYQSSDLKRVS
jgi:hypothetical protein